MLVNIGISDIVTGKTIPHTTRKIDASTANATSQIHRKPLRRSAMSTHDIEKIHETNYLKNVIVENYLTTKPDLLGVILNEEIFNFSLAKTTVDEVVNKLDKKKN